MSWFFTADTHLGHLNIIKHCLRPFIDEPCRQMCLAAKRGEISPYDISLPAECVQAMDDAIITSINSTVGPNDSLAIIGDFCLAKRGSAIAAYRDYRSRIKCKNVHLVLGNHDDREAALAVFATCGETMMVRSDGHEFFLSHYPARSWDRSNHGSIMLYGHVHGYFAAEDEGGASEASCRQIKDGFASALTKRGLDANPELLNELLATVNGSRRLLKTLDVGVDNLRPGMPFGTPWSAGEIVLQIAKRFRFGS